MTTDRSYRKALPREEAVAELLRNRGTQFDPAVVDALVALAARQPAAA
jgi:HD-GYP domain-containing protein (c-di-GMP phosphodiesterase class II)